MVVLAAIAALLAVESLYFYRQTVACFDRLIGERAFYRSDLGSAWTAYQRALARGGPTDQLETDLIEVLLFGLDQQELGLRLDLPLSGDAIVAETRGLIRRAIRRAPFRAVNWSIASDMFLREDRMNRRRVPLDLSTVSEQPLENLSVQDWWGIVALEKAASLEPSNYVYDDLIAEQFLSYGAAEQAATACRRAVFAYPRIEGHLYLNRTELPGPVLEAAIAGFEDALQRRSLIARGFMELDAGRLLAFQGQDERAVTFFERAEQTSPDSYDVQMELALALFRLGRFKDAIPHFAKAASRVPDEASTYYYLGQAQTESGDRAAGLESFRKARMLGRGAAKYFHAFATALETEGRLDEAERQFTAAAYHNPTDSSAWSTLLAFHLRRGDESSASRDCDKLKGLKDESESIQEQCATIGRFSQ